jgi:hypothetical protein
MRGLRGAQVSGGPPQHMFPGQMLRSEDEVEKGPMGLGESTGARNNGPAPVSSDTAASGAPKPKKNQRGHKKSPIEQALDAVQDAQEVASDPSKKTKDSNLPG